MTVQHPVRAGIRLVGFHSGSGGDSGWRSWCCPNDLPVISRALYCLSYTPSNLVSAAGVEPTDAAFTPRPAPRGLASLYPRSHRRELVAVGGFEPPTFPV